VLLNACQMDLFQLLYRQFLAHIRLLILSEEWTLYNFNKIILNTNPLGSFKSHLQKISWRTSHDPRKCNIERQNFIWPDLISLLGGCFLKTTCHGFLHVFLADLFGFSQAHYNNISWGCLNLEHEAAPTCICEEICFSKTHVYSVKISMR